MLLEEHARAGAMLQNAAAMVVDLKRARSSKRQCRREVDAMAHGTRASSDMDRSVVAMALAISSSVASSPLASLCVAVLSVALKVRTDVA
jgi:hypothetical protein